MRDDLDAPGALAVVDRWADRLLADAPTRITPADVAGADLVRDTADALLGIRLRPLRTPARYPPSPVRTTCPANLPPAVVVAVLPD